MIKYIIFLFMGNLLMAQTVTTYVNDAAADIDDAMVFDTDGNLYGSNFAGTTVYKVTPDGVVTPFVTGLSNANGVALDNQGNLFVCNYSAQQIQKHDSDGNLLDTYPIGGSPSGLISSFNPGAMVFTNVSNNSVNTLDPSGNIVELVQGGVLNAPVGLAYDENGTLYIGNYVGREIYKLNGTTLEYVATVPDGGATSNPFLGFITYAADGYLYGTILGGHKIYRIDPTQTDEVTLFAGFTQGSADGDIGVATFDTPNGIYYNEADGALYVSEFSGVGNVRKIDGFIFGMDDFDEDNFSLAPNPAANSISIAWNESLGIASAHWSLYSITGRLLKEDKLDGNMPIDISDLAAGTYVISIRLSNGEESTQRFLKL